MNPLRIRAALVLTLSLAGCGARPEHAARRAAGGSAPSAVEASGGALVPADASAILALARGGARATVVNVWATWCEPCREEFPELLQAARAHQADGVRLILVSTDFDEQLPEVHRFLSAQGVHDTTYLKRGRDQAFIDTLNPGWSGTIPATFVYDAAGHPVAFWEGRADRARFDAAIRKALETPTTRTRETHS